MKDDWLKDFDLEDLKDKSEPTADEQKDIPLDSLGIPILEEVVFLEDDYSFDDEITFDSIPEPEVEDITNAEDFFPDAPTITSPPQAEASTIELEEEQAVPESSDPALINDPVTEIQETEPPEINESQRLEKLKSALKFELRQTMEQISSSLAWEITENITVDLEQRVAFELKQVMHEKIDTMVDRAFDESDKDQTD